MRATTSVGPPGGKPTNMRTGLVGHTAGCAWLTLAPAEANTAATNISRPLKNFIRKIMVILLTEVLI